MRLTEEEMLEKYDNWIWKNYHELVRYFYSLDPEDIFQECQIGFLLSVRALDSRGDNLRDQGIFALSKVAMYRRVSNLLAKEMLQRKARTEVSLNKEDWWACAPLSLHPTDVIRFNRFRENALSQNFSSKGKKAIATMLSELIDAEEVAQKVGLSRERVRLLLNRICDGQYSKNQNCKRSKKES